MPYKRPGMHGAAPSMKGRATRRHLRDRRAWPSESGKARARRQIGGRVVAVVHACCMHLAQEMQGWFGTIPFANPVLRAWLVPAHYVSKGNSLMPRLRAVSWKRHLKNTPKPSQRGPADAARVTSFPAGNSGGGSGTTPVTMLRQRTKHFARDAWRLLNEHCKPGASRQWIREAAPSIERARRGQAGGGIPSVLRRTKGEATPDIGFDSRQDGSQAARSRHFCG